VLAVLQTQKEQVVPTAPEAAPAPVVEVPFSVRESIGTSVEGRTIEAYSYGTGTTHILFVGGIHGGYEWNSVILAYELVDHLEAHYDVVPSDTTVIVVPNANPDGVYDVLGTEGRFSIADVPAYEGPAGNGRFNARGVDLNRNFDCKWQPESRWRGNVVSAGVAPFSEPETQAIRDLVLRHTPQAVVFFHSQSNAVYASECYTGILPETRVIMNLYAGETGYPAIDTFDAYVITGDAEGWLASIGIPAITVELSSHTSVEWERNRPGIEALIRHLSKEVEA